MIEIIPAILTSDTDEFKKTIAQIVNFEAHTAQIDFTDGKFVESKTLLPDDLDAFILSQSGLILEAHLMTEKPQQYFNTLFTLGFNRVALHYQTLDHPEEAIHEAHEFEFEVGLALNPEVDLQKVEPFISELDFLLFMTVVPGEMGHPFEEQVLQKIHLEHMHGLKHQHKDIVIEVDGGVHAKNIQEVVNAGADRIVVGSGIWHADAPGEAYEDLRQLANTA